MYRVIKLFTDLEDNHYLYKIGDCYPRDGLEVGDERVKELSGHDNKQGQPLIEVMTDILPEVKELSKGRPRTAKREV